LITLPGVGRKTANVVLGVAFGIPAGVVVDTHVQRLSQRLGFTKQTKPETIEMDLSGLFPRDHWVMLAHVLIFHGRRVCFAQRPACGACGIHDLCPNAFKADKVGRKPPRKRKPAVVDAVATKVSKRKSAAVPKKKAPAKAVPAKKSGAKAVAAKKTLPKKVRAAPTSS
jgi:endonuclease-3